MPRGVRTRAPRNEPGLSGEISAEGVRPHDKHEDSAHGSGLDRVIKGVSLDRRPAGVADQLLNARSRHAAAGWRSGAMNDALFDDRAIEIIGSKSKRDLCERWSQRHPVGLDVRK